MVLIEGDAAAAAAAAVSTPNGRRNLDDDRPLLAVSGT
jgi:hypothetical protein